MSLALAFSVIAVIAVLAAMFARAMSAQMSSQHIKSIQEIQEEILQAQRQTFQPIDDSAQRALSAAQQAAQARFMRQTVVSHYKSQLNVQQLVGGPYSSMTNKPAHIWLAGPILSAPSCDIYPRDEQKPDTLGWRGWMWNGEALFSPNYGTEWYDAELHVEKWDESDVVRGVAGIHALLVAKDWMLCDWRNTEIGPTDVHGIVERFGRYVLGREGWRAEWVIIRELATRDRAIGEALKLKYPNIPIHYVKLGSEIL